MLGQDLLSERFCGEGIPNWALNKLCAVRTTRTARDQKTVRNAESGSGFGLLAEHLLLELPTACVPSPIPGRQRDGRPDDRAVLSADRYRFRTPAEHAHAHRMHRLTAVHASRASYLWLVRANRLVAAAQCRLHAVVWIVGRL
jgi:hypothetical protein